MIKLPAFFLGISGLAAMASASVDESLDDLMSRAILSYAERLESATSELVEVRERIADERAPLVEAAHELEDRILSLEAEISYLETTSVRAEAERLESETEWELVIKNLDYISRMARENLEALESDLLPGESLLYGDRIKTYLQVFERPSKLDQAAAALDASDLLLDRLQRQLGGNLVEGSALSVDDDRVLEGRFAFVGPETFFADDDFEIAGPVRLREGTLLPAVYSLREWDRAQAELFFSGETGKIPLDASGGKALPLQESRESVFGHLKKGGIVGYVILGLGAFAFVTGLIKIADLRRLSIDDPSSVRKVLEALVVRSIDETESAVRSLRATTQGLFAAGIRQIGKPKTVLEEHLFAFILRQRIDHERRLPFLAVIAAAAPLLGLLGTVVGMVKTFTLITVYGTGNAGKLSSGISEALITTELGLIVAIPTLVLHGYLSYRTQKNLSMLEQYAVEFVTASEERKLEREGGEEASP
jgi:biopolymer transport protein ExbB